MIISGQRSEVLLHSGRQSHLIRSDLMVQTGVDCVVGRRSILPRAKPNLDASALPQLTRGQLKSPPESMAHEWRLLN
jgi:hypothetical protein